MANLVKVICSDAWLKFCSSNIKDLPGQPTDFAHCLLCVGIEKLNLGPIETVFGLGDARLRVGPVGALD